MDLPLLYGVPYGHTWFGRWAYKFSHGSFGIMEHNYENAIEMLSSIELDQVIPDFRYSSRSNVMKQVERLQLWVLAIGDSQHVGGSPQHQSC